MTDNEPARRPTKFGTGEFEFGEWKTPFTDADAWILSVLFLANAPVNGSAELAVVLQEGGASRRYEVRFRAVQAMRALDESGLMELWNKSAELGGRPGKTTFRVRNHDWSLESWISILGTDGWSFFIATNDMCLEVVSSTPPTIL